MLTAPLCEPFVCSMATSDLLSRDFFVCTVKAHTQCIRSLMISILECYSVSFQKHICVCCLVWCETGQDVMDSNTKSSWETCFHGLLVLGFCTCCLCWNNDFGTRYLWLEL